MSVYDRRIVFNKQRSRQIAMFAAGLLRRGERPGIIFVRSQAHGQELVEALHTELGRDVPLVSSQMTERRRAALADQRRRQAGGDEQLVVSLPVWTTGLDIPGLQWVLLAAEGSAPVGLKQAAGRATRRADGKPGFKIYDWQTVGEDLARYQEHAAKRQAHFEEAGFKVAGASEAPAPDPQSEADAALLSKLLEHGPPAQRQQSSAPARAAAARAAAPDPSEGLLGVLWDDFQGRLWWIIAGCLVLYIYLECRYWVLTEHLRRLNW